MPPPADTPPDTLFHFDPNHESFEDRVRPNGTDTWSARELAQALGYATWESFQAVIQRAQKAVISSGHDVTLHFQREEVPGVGLDIRLTKFACYMVAMNGSATKPQVAKAQAYFATLAEVVQKVISGAGDIERVLIRAELTEENRALAGAAKAHGAVSGLDYALFMDAGYRGLYNMSCKALAAHRGLEGAAAKRLFDFMGTRELAANLFRAAETRAIIEGQNVQGNAALQHTHAEVGRRVRQTMLANTGEAPEQLKPAADMKKVLSDLKRTGKALVDPKAAQQSKPEIGDRQEAEIPDDE